MRFRFCWDCDCPDWLLAEMIVLSKISSVNLRSMTLAVSESIYGERLDYERIVEMSATELDTVGTQASIAAIRWILESAAGSDTDPKILDSELQQLGLPKDQSGSIKEIYFDQKEHLRKALRDQSLKASGKVTWDYELKGINLGQSQEPVVKFTLEGEILDQSKYPPSNLVTNSKSDSKLKTDSDNKTELYMLPDQLNGLLYELRKAYEDMKELEQS